MMKIAIVEDNEQAGNSSAKYIAQYFTALGQKWNLSRFANGLEFISCYKDNYDIVLMDIDMPVMNGLEAARTLRNAGGQSQIIFITNHMQYALRGYDVDAAGYLIKPIAYPQLQKALDRAISRLNRSHTKSLTLTINRELVIFNTDLIYYVEVRDHYLIITTKNGEYQVKKSMREIEEELLPAGFCRSSHSYLVNLQYVSAVGGNYVTIASTDGKTMEVPLSRNKKDEFLCALMEYTR